MPTDRPSSLLGTFLESTTTTTSSRCSSSNNNNSSRHGDNSMIMIMAQPGKNEQPSSSLPAVEGSAAVTRSPEQRHEEEEEEDNPEAVDVVQDVVPHPPPPSSSSSSTTDHHHDDASSALSSSLSFAKHYHLLQDRLLTALHEEDWDILEDLLEDFPCLARETIPMVVQGENSSCLPLHYCAAHKSTPVSTIDALVTAHPNSLLVKESRAGRLALHLAVLKGAASFATVRYLVEAMPASLAVADQEGNLPLHAAALNGGGTNAVVQLLLHAYPAACAHPNQRSARLPLHLLCARCWDHGCCASTASTVISVDTIQQVMDAYPAALQAPDRRGRLPLHVCCSSHPRADILQVLVDRYPPALLVASDHSKWTPLDLVRMFSGIDHKHNNNSNTSSSNSDVVSAFLMEATNREQRKKYKFLAPFKQVGSKIARRRRQHVRRTSEAELYSCYG